MPKKTIEVKEVEVKLKPSYGIEPTRIYANFAEISQSPYDFTIKFCDATPIRDFKKLKEADGVHDIPVVAEIAVPHAFVPGLIRALKTQYENYQEAIGENNDGKQNKKTGKK
ncbi:MAG: DUF3467 domain-containing protein [Desulfosalsimonadaceae bacterium]